MTLQALDGLGEVNATEVLKEKVGEAIKRLPKGDIKDIVSSLPEDVIRELCKRGVNDEINKYLPSAIAGVIAGGVVYYLTGSLVYSGLTALIGATILSYITVDNDSN